MAQTCLFGTIAPFVQRRISNPALAFLVSVQRSATGAQIVLTNGTSFFPHARPITPHAFTQPRTTLCVWIRTSFAMAERPCTFSNKIADRRKCFVNVTEIQFRSRKKSNYFAADKDVRSDKRQQRAHSPGECSGQYFQHQICQLGHDSKYDKLTMIEAGV